MDFKRRLSDAIARAGLADGEVADRLRAAGFDASHDRVYRWRRGRSLPGVDELPAVAEALGADLTWLATGRRDTGTLDPEEATALVVLRSLRLPLDEAIRRLSSPAPAAAPPASVPLPPRAGEPFPAQPEPEPPIAPPSPGRRRGSA